MGSSGGVLEAPGGVIYYGVAYNRRCHGPWPGCYSTIPLRTARKTQSLGSASWGRKNICANTRKDAPNVFLNASGDASRPPRRRLLSGGSTPRAATRRWLGWEASTPRTQRRRPPRKEASTPPERGVDPPAAPYNAPGVGGSFRGRRLRRRLCGESALNAGSTLVFLSDSAHPAALRMARGHREDVPQLPDRPRCRPRAWDHDSVDRRR